MSPRERRACSVFILFIALTAASVLFSYAAAYQLVAALLAVAAAVHALAVIVRTGIDQHAQALRGLNMIAIYGHDANAAAAMSDTTGTTQEGAPRSELLRRLGDRDASRLPGGGR